MQTRIRSSVKERGKKRDIHERKLGIDTSLKKEKKKREVTGGKVKLKKTPAG